MSSMTTQQQMEESIQMILKERANQKEGQRIVSMMNPSFSGCNPEEKSLTLAYQVEEWQLNPHHIMHGGLITTAIDTTFGTLTHYLSPNRIITTVDISISFLKPVPLHDTLLVTATANSVGRTLVSLTARATLKNSGLLAATGTSTFMILGERKNK